MNFVQTRTALFLVLFAACSADRSPPRPLGTHGGARNGDASSDAGWESGVRVDAGADSGCRDAIRAVASGVDGTLSEATGLEVCRTPDGRVDRVDRLTPFVCPPRLTPLPDGGANDDQCAEDSDCGPGSVCLCAAFIPPAGGSTGPQAATLGSFRCVPADCASPADCGGRGCGLNLNVCSRDRGFYCRTAEDECSNRTDCPDGRYCAYFPDRGYWACDTLVSCDFP